MEKIRIILVDDHSLFRSGVAAHLSRQADMEVVGEASDGLEGLKLADMFPADIMLLDLEMPGLSGKDVLASLREKHPEIAVLMLTVNEDCSQLSECLALGAKGYLLKNVDKDFLLRAIRTAAAGESIMSPQMMRKFLDRFKATFANMPNANLGMMGTPMGGMTAQSTNEPTQSKSSCTIDPSVLTRRERQTLCWVARGLSNKEVARTLNLAESTVKVHVQSILRKLNLSSRVQAAVYAIEHGIDQSEK